MNGESDSLVLIHCVMRHGHKTRDRLTAYPTDPYGSHAFYPYGEGMLTNEGKSAMYDTGKALRKRYDGFLGELYFSNQVEVWSTDFERCKASAQLALAGMFPPKGVQKWSDGLDWQPIPVNYKLIDDDQMMASIVRHPVFMRMYNKTFKSGYGKRLLEKYAKIVEHLEKHTGWEIPSARRVLFLKDNLNCVREFGLEVPAWCKEIYLSQAFDDFAYEEYKMESHNRGLRRIVSGLLLRKILTDSLDKIKGTSERKMHLYSCHDVNVANFLINLGAMYPHFPDYAATVALEFHRFGDKYGFKLFYKKNIKSDFIVMTFGNDEEILLLEDYEKIVNDIWTNDETTEDF